MSQDPPRQKGVRGMGEKLQCGLATEPQSTRPGKFPGVALWWYQHRLAADSSGSAGLGKEASRMSQWVHISAPAPTVLNRNILWSLLGSHGNGSTYLHFSQDCKEQLLSAQPSESKQGRGGTGRKRSLRKISQSSFRKSVFPANVSVGLERGWR